MELKIFQNITALANIYEILEEMRKDAENLPKEAMAAPLLDKIDKIYDNLQNIKFDYMKKD